MKWPQESNHYIDIRLREEYENPQLSYGDSCRKAYKRDFGKEYEGEIDGELGWAAISDNYK